MAVAFDQYGFNEGRCYSSVLKNPNGAGWVVMVTHVPSGESIAVRNPVERLEDAHQAARVWALAGDRVAASDPDALEGYLSERLGF